MTKPRTKPRTEARHDGEALATSLLATEAVKITRALVHKALAGNMRALRLCIERLVPISRERALPVRIPAPQDALQITIALKAVFDGLGSGKLTPGEAQKLAAILENQRKAIETGDLEERLQALESGPPPSPHNVPDDLSNFPRDLEPDDPDEQDDPYEHDPQQ